jgi:predicted metalloprotease
MDWRGGRRGGNIEDRRGMGAGGLIGGGGIGALILAGIGYFVFGIDPRTTLSAVEAVQGQGAVQQEGVRGVPADETAQFVDVIASSADDVWKQLLPDYASPQAIVIYDQATGTGCGTGQSAMGPFYCPADQRVYLDLSFWTELESRFGAKGEFARAYVVAHEVGHHLQNQTGALRRGQGAGATGAMGGAVRVELQADCYAGVWAHHAGAASGGGIVINPADIEDGLGAAAAVGDDAIQSRTQGRIVPDAFTHGTSAQRMRWFRIGYDSGDPNRCDTFSARSL